jgi:hypothetical protein
MHPSIWSLYGLVLLIVSAQAGAQDNACQGMASTWHDATGTYVFSQASNGTLTGTLKTSSGSTCPGGQDYKVAGTLVNGVFSLTATWQDDGFADNNPRPTTCAQTITYSGNVTGPGCVHADGNLSNSSNFHTDFHMVGSCIVPAGETSIFAAWVPIAGYTSNARFQQSLPGGFNYGGRVVGEAFQNAGSDGCYFPGSKFPPQTSPTAYTAPIPNLGLPSIYDDDLARRDDILLYYRQAQPLLPCSFVTNQRESIDCSSNSPPDTYFQTNQLLFTLDERTVRYYRGSAPSGDLVWGPPASKLIIVPTLFRLLKHH